jgi:hypothetical protein
MRTNTIDASRRSQTSTSRATIREFDDDHDMQEIKQADVMHSESPTSFERWQQAGMSVHPMPQAQDDQQQQQDQQGDQGGGGGGGGGGNTDMSKGFNDKQPKGPSAEGIILYVGGSRAHPVMVGIDDRRVRPYQTKPGEALYYSADGSGQTMYHRVRGDGKDGLYLLTCDDAQGSGHGVNGRAGQKPQSRYVSVRHVNKKKQKRKSKSLQPGQGQSGGGGGGAALGFWLAGVADEPGFSEQAAGGGDGQQQEDYKHEGDSVNTETRHTAQQIQHYDGDTNVGHYDRGNKDWIFHTGSTQQSARADKKHSHIKHDGAHCWMEGGCFHSIPWVLKADDCK